MMKSYFHPLIGHTKLSLATKYCHRDRNTESASVQRTAPWQFV